MQLAFILGRTPALAQKEIEAVATILPFPWTSSMVQPNILLLNPTGVEVAESGSQHHELLPLIDRMQRQLGGTSEIVRILDVVDRGSLIGRLQQVVMSETPSSRLDFGVSVYGGGVKGQPGLTLKKGLKEAGLSVRYVAPKEGSALSSAQVYHNRLAMIGQGGRIQSGRELVAIQDGSLYRIGYALTVQDIDSYARRDFGLPYPDSASGMLPPKLAQTMINLAVGAADDVAVYDPFCGNGRVVLEARLMGLKSYGSDIDPKKVESSRGNLAWQANEAGFAVEDGEIVWQHDARQRTPRDFEGEFAIVSEPWLGAPLRQPLPASGREAWLAELADLYGAFFGSWKEAPRKPTCMVMVFPCAKLADGGEAALYPHLVDRLAALGYSSSVQGRYSRPDTLISRDIVTITYG